MTPEYVACTPIVGDIDIDEETRSVSSIFARPKSSTFTFPLDVSLIFAGFKSRWTTPCECAASSASAICLAMGRASSSGMGPCSMRSASVGPSTSSSTSACRTSGIFEPVDGADVWVIERREHLRFTPEPREPIRIERERIRKYLQRNVAIELAVARTIDLAHAACAEGRQNFIGTESGAGAERHAEEVRRFYFVMCARSFSFSLQTYSRMSVSACSRCVTCTVNGLL